MNEPADGGSFRERAQHRWSIRATVIQWLYQEALAGNKNPALTAGAVAIRTGWTGLTEEEVHDASSWLKENGLITGTSASGGWVPRPVITVAGERAAESEDGLVTYGNPADSLANSRGVSTRVGWSMVPSDHPFFGHPAVQQGDILQESKPGQQGLAGDANVNQETVADQVDPRTVFVVHGRDLDAKDAVYGFLRALDLRPLDWEELVAATGSASPYVGDTIKVAFQKARAVVVLLTPDDEARLSSVLHGSEEPPHETNLTGQARPNVLFEAGMALASHPDRTILVQIGTVRPFSDVAGRHIVRLTGAPASLQALASRLRSAGCAVDLTGSGWLGDSRIQDLAAHTRRPGAGPERSN